MGKFCLGCDMQYDGFGAFEREPCKFRKYPVFFERRRRRMLGAIIGDIAGSRFEFDNRRSKEFELFAEACFTTDDSIMTLAAEIKTYLGVLSFRTPQLSEVRYD